MLDIPWSSSKIVIFIFVWISAKFCPSVGAFTVKEGATLSTKNPSTVVLKFPAVSLIVTVNVLFSDWELQLDALNGYITVRLFSTLTVESQLEKYDILSTLEPTPLLYPDKLIPTLEVIFDLLMALLLHAPIPCSFVKLKFNPGMVPLCTLNDTFSSKELPHESVDWTIT